MGSGLTAEYSQLLGFSFDTTLGNNLTFWRNAVMNQDIDCAVIVDGNEGSGKSICGAQIAKFLDVDHHIDLDTQMCFFPEQFKKAVTTLPKFKAIIWDEARRGLNRRRSMGDVNLEIGDMLAECRQNNLFLVIIMPSFYDMDMTAAVWRSRLLVHVSYSWNSENVERPLVRGFFRFYSEDGKKDLYTDNWARRRYAYPFLKDRCFDGRFSNTYVVDENRYRQMKKDAEETYRKAKEEQKEEKKANGEVIKKFSVSCPKCGHEWLGNTKSPSQCPKCHIRRPMEVGSGALS